MTAPGGGPTVLAMSNEERVIKLIDDLKVELPLIDAAYARDEMIVASVLDGLRVLGEEVDRLAERVSDLEKTTPQDPVAVAGSELVDVRKAIRKFAKRLDEATK